MDERSRQEELAPLDTLIDPRQEQAAGESSRAPTPDSSGERLRKQQVKALLLDDPSLQPRIGRFVVIDKIGEGGMGTVHAAFDRQLDRKVALKLVRASHRDDPRLRDRMLREAQAMARLSHPNVIPVFEVGELGSSLYLAMEYVDGQSLARWQRTPRPWRAVLEMYRNVGAGLSAAHEAGLIHRDFKPENVLIGGDGRPRVIDFGLARGALEAGTERAFLPGATLERDLLDTPLTRTGALLGTPAYMSPEQFQGGEIGAASDQFSFCVALFEALHGRPPFSRESIATLLEALEAGVDPALPEDSEVPAWVHAAVVRGLSRDPAARWPSMAALLDALARDPELDPTTGIRTRVGYALALAAIGVIAWLIVTLTDLNEFGTDPRFLLGAALVLAALWLLPAYALRRRLAASRFNNQLLACFLAGNALLILNRLVSVIVGSSGPVALAHEIAALTSLALFAALVVARWLVWSALIGVVGTLGAALWLEHASEIYTAAGSLMVVVAGLLSRRHGVDGAGR